ncbi:MAG: DNA primase [bacterium]|nr:DNA primase [bacterium]
MSITPEIIESVKARASITEVVSEYVQLRPSGSMMKGCCPFHNEKTPSFVVYEADARYHCFGCGAHGSVFDFLIEKKGYSFPEAVKFLARRVGVVVPETKQSPERRKEAEEKNVEEKRTKVLIQLAAQAFRGFLLSHKDSLTYCSYLERRSIRQETAERFSLGAAPATNVWLRPQLEKIVSGDERLRNLFKGVNLETQLCQAGVMRKGDHGTYDTFRDRVIFPISRSDGSIIGFGGRIVDDSGGGRPKYINSPETSVYEKRRVLYGMYQGLPEARKKHEAFLVEGYLDVISMHQVGFTNVFATCGTALTREHAELLKRHVKRVWCVFDGDRAGRKAAGKAFEAFLNLGVELQVVLLPAGEDPDTCSRRGQEAIARLFQENSISGFRCFMDDCIHDITSGNEHSAVMMGTAAAHITSVIAKVNNSVERTALVRETAARFGVSEGVVWRLLKGDAPRTIPPGISQAIPRGISQAIPQNNLQRTATGTAGSSGASSWNQKSTKDGKAIPATTFASSRKIALPDSRNLLARELLTVALRSPSELKAAFTKQDGVLLSSMKGELGEEFFSVLRNLAGLPKGLDSLVAGGGDLNVFLDSAKVILGNGQLWGNSASQLLDLAISQCRQENGSESNVVVNDILRRYSEGILPVKSAGNGPSTVEDLQKQLLWRRNKNPS